MSAVQIHGNNEIGKGFAADGMAGKTKESKAKDTTESFSKILQNLKMIKDTLVEESDRVAR